MKKFRRRIIGSHFRGETRYPSADRGDVLVHDREINYLVAAGGKIEKQVACVILLLLVVQAAR